ncbi:MAG: DUF1549 domain-containing protein [Planctomyces sp.]|jgi:hypothetical protein
MKRSQSQQWRDVFSGVLRGFRSAAAGVIAVTIGIVTINAAVGTVARAESPEAVAERVSQSIQEELSGVPLPAADDSTYLRRVCLDIAGRSASPSEITTFGLDPSPTKRADVVQQLLESDDYATTWARYWSDAIFLRATNIRAGLAKQGFETWIAEELSKGTGWNEIVASLLTASGSVAENGETALVFAHEGVPEEIAAEASRLFLGVQIQCANCHDHPWDRWKREQFHEFVAFFPRVSVRRDPKTEKKQDFMVVSVDTERKRGPGFSKFLLTRADRDRDGFITDTEAAKTPLARILKKNKELIDKDKDGKVSVTEILTAQPPDNNRPGQGATEHYMPDLKDPASQGERVDPDFFLNDEKIAANMTDAERRGKAADLVTDRDNPWFARAIVNRIWYEMTGTAFCLPVDDIGPDRTISHEPALKILSDEFVSSKYDLKWLIRTIAATTVYQRVPNSTAEDFARCEPMRMRSDQLYASLCQTLNVTDLPMMPTEVNRQAGQPRRPGSSRDVFANVFGFDPSTARSDLTGSIPESLFLMNSGLLTRMIANPADSGTVSRILSTVQSDDDAVRELYLLAVGREPTDGELEVARGYLKDGERRGSMEDILWALVNSPEFRSKR